MLRGVGEGHALEGECCSNVGTKGGGYGGAFAPGAEIVSITRSLLADGLSAQVETILSDDSFGGSGDSAVPAINGGGGGEANKKAGGSSVSSHNTTK